MEESLHDDVKALLDKDLEMIEFSSKFSEHENDEVISNFERNYVKKLAEKHLAESHQLNHLKFHQKKKNSSRRSHS